MDTTLPIMRSLKALAVLIFAVGVCHAAPPPNDNFANRITVTGSSAQFNSTHVGATIENGEPKHSRLRSNENSVWYTWTAPSAGGVVIVVKTTNPSFVTPIVAVYRGNILGTLTKIGD